MEEVTTEEIALDIQVDALTGASGTLAAGDTGRGAGDEPSAYPDEYARHNVTFDEMEEAIGSEQQELVRAARVYSEEIAEKNRQRCTRDWMYCLFHNYADTNMDEQLAEILTLVRTKYSLGEDDGQYNPINAQKRRFITQTLAYVHESRNIVAKQALVLAILAREPELQESMRMCCPAEHIEDLLSQLPALTSQIIDVPFNRINVAFYLTQFLRACSDAYFKGVWVTPVTQNLQHSGKMQVEVEEGR